MLGTESTDHPWQSHTAALFETAGKYPTEHYMWLFGSLFMIAVMIITTRIDGFRAQHLFVFSFHGVTNEMMPCMPSFYNTVSNGKHNTMTAMNRIWGFRVTPLLTTNICYMFPWVVFADYTKVMGTPA